MSTRASDTNQSTASRSRSRAITRARALACVVAVAAAVLTWAAGTLLSSNTEPRVDGEMVGVTAFIVSATIATLAGWATLEALERWVRRRPLIIWAVGAVLVLVGSMAGPLLTPDLTVATRAILSIAHLAVFGAFVGPVLRVGPRRRAVA